MESKPPEVKSEADPLLAQSDPLAGEPVKDVIIVLQEQLLERLEGDIDCDEAEHLLANNPDAKQEAKKCQCQVKQYLAQKQRNDFREKECDVDTGLNGGKFLCYSYSLNIEFDYLQKISPNLQLKQRAVSLLRFLQNIILRYLCSHNENE